ncbi:(2E,6E)-farnesyl diphosphate synthase [Pantoea sp. Aalb]|uniref:(2E,6E)-farnesyl diphosphate synthase n=1 Tax=Pantoea sp. Aalb TaxID=2576762 RepID=UPI001321E21A|nr:(2E,6E)-farnesyl diphosphate synthase [Pantoea sp. Aalb]MXP67583.1 (2E,6E)-farnesyl diphosphate synthase [Pantoea sp. Aalb]
MNFDKSLSDYYEHINLVLKQLIDSLPFQNSSLINVMRYGTILGGKRLRPFLVYATGEMFHVDLISLDAPAAAVECIHAYSLIHDDLPAMDNDTLRRGQPTCHVKYGEDMAILAGDALQTLAFSVLADKPMLNVSVNTRVAMISELAHASGISGMCGGQALDLITEGQSIDLIQLEQIHNHKTGALIRASVRLGALAAGNRSHAVLPVLDIYANAIGLAFQVQDDILNVIGNTTILGKTQGTDRILEKNTYPTLMGLERAYGKVCSLYDEAIKALKTLELQSYNTNALQALTSFIIKRDK